MNISGGKFQAQVKGGGGIKGMRRLRNVIQRREGKKKSGILQVCGQRGFVFTERREKDPNSKKERRGKVRRGRPTIDA